MTDLVPQLSRITADLVPLAIVWHVALPLAWRHPGPFVLSLFAVSVAMVAWAYGNPFNAISFATLAAILAGSRPRSRARPLGLTVTLGAALVAFGALYPHFVAGPAYRLVWAAPLGLVPCPTLAAISGLAIATGAIGSRRSAYALAAWTAFYGLFGVFRLGVGLDLVLLVAALAVAISAAVPRHPITPWRTLT
jgi:hypothetical protein